MLQNIGNALSTSATPVVTIKEGKVFANSRDVAEFFGKQHYTILETIDHLPLEPDAEAIAQNFLASVAEVGGGFGKRHVRAYDMNRDGFTELVMGFTGAKARKFKRAYIAQFNAMEEGLKRHGASYYGAYGLHWRNMLITPLECSSLVPMGIEITDSSEFIVSSPDQQVGLSLEIERGTAPVEFINRYHADHDVRCAFCAAHSLHKRGFTVRMADGRIALCGIDCAGTFFGEEVVSRFSDDLEKQIQHQAQRRVITRTVGGAPVSLAVLNADWIDLENVYYQAVCGVRLWVHAEDIQEGLSEGRLILKRVRSKWIVATGKDGRETKRKERFEEVEGRVLRASCLLVREKRLGIAKAGLNALAGWADRPEKIKGALAEELTAKRSHVIGMLKDGVAFTRAAHTFFQPDNVAMFKRWFALQPSGREPSIRMDEDRRLIIDHPKADQPPIVLQLPHEIPDPEALMAPLTSRS